MAKIGSVVFDHIADEHILPQPIYCQNNIMFILLTAATCNADNPLLSWWTPEKPAFRRCSIAAASPVQAARCRGSLGAGICLYGYRAKLNSVRFRYNIPSHIKVHVFIANKSGNVSFLSWGNFFFQLFEWNKATQYMCYRKYYTSGPTFPPGNISWKQSCFNTNFNGTKISSSALLSNCPFFPQEFVVFWLTASEIK